jgi:hypothetical protein
VTVGRWDARCAEARPCSSARSYSADRWRARLLTMGVLVSARVMEVCSFRMCNQACSSVSNLNAPLASVFPSTPAYPSHSQHTQPHKQDQGAGRVVKDCPIQVPPRRVATPSPQGGDKGRGEEKVRAVLSATGVGSLSALACSLSAACSAVRAQRPGPGPRGQSAVQSKAGWQGVQKCRAVAKTEACCLSRCARW